MDHAPLNLAHFHERRAEKFLRHYRYDDAQDALETSLLYLQNAYKSCMLPKSIEILNTQKWDYERKLHQIQMRKQHERLKLKEILLPPPTAETNSILFRPEHNVTAQSVAKLIDKTIQDFDAKFTNSNQRTTNHLNRNNSASSTQALVATQSKLPNQDSPTAPATTCANTKTFVDRTTNTPPQHLETTHQAPMLAPLELPSFDFNVFSSNVLAENFQK